MRNITKRLINPKSVSFNKVLKTFYKEHNLKIGTNKWALKVLKETNKNFGYWIEAKLPKNIFLKIILPHHFHGSIKLVPKKGSTVKEAFERLIKCGKEYKKKCEKCIETIEYFSNKNLGHVYLSDGKPNNLYGYPKIRYLKGNLVHLNGLHRLLSILYSKKDAYSPIKCYIAVKTTKRKSF